MKKFNQLTEDEYINFIFMKFPNKDKNSNFNRQQLSESYKKSDGIYEKWSLDIEKAYEDFYDGKIKEMKNKLLRRI